MKWQEQAHRLKQEVNQGIEEPLESNVLALVQQFDQLLKESPEREWLELGGLYLSCLCELHYNRAMAVLDDWEEQYNHDGPIFSDDLLQGLVKESQTIDVSAFVKPETHLYPARTPGEEELDEICVELDMAGAIALAEQDLSKATSELSHDEDVGRWVEVLEEYFRESPGAVGVETLPGKTGLEWVEVLLGLLLGGFELWQEEGGFYQRASLWAQMREEKEEILITDNVVRNSHGG
jgi:hypothetical protein